MNNEQERNEHFKGFARLTLQKLMNKYDHLPPGEWGPAESDEIILAQCAYDLVNHTCTNITGSMINWHIEDRVHAIPDLAEWPKSQ